MDLNLKNILGWGYSDIEALKSYIKIAEKFNIYPEDIKEDIREYQGDATDINSWLYSVISAIFYKITQEIREIANENKDTELLERIDELENEFNPFINYMDSWFSNFLDNIDFNQDKQKILNDIIEELRED